MLQVVDFTPSQRFLGVGVGNRAPRSRVHVAVVVAGDDDFLGMWKCVEPVELGLDLGDCAGVAEVAGVDEDVACWDGGRGLRVRVGETNEADAVGWWWVVGSAAEEEDERVDVADEEFEGGGEEGVEE